MRIKKTLGRCKAIAAVFAAVCAAAVLGGGLVCAAGAAPKAGAPSGKSTAKIDPARWTGLAAALSPEAEQKRQERMRREFAKELEAAASGSPSEALARLETLQNGIHEEIEDRQTSISRQQERIKGMEAGSKKSLAADLDSIKDDPHLSHEERLRRQQLRMQSEAGDAPLNKARAEVAAWENDLAWANERLHLIEQKTVELKAKEVRVVADGSEAVGAAGAVEPRKKRTIHPKETPNKTAAVAEETTPTKLADEYETSPIIAAPPERTYPMPPLALGFLRDRALDLCDLLRFRAHIPRGYRSVGLKARVTCLAQLGFVFFEGRSVGLDRRGAGLWREWRLEGGVGPVYSSRVQDEMIAGNRFTDVEHPWSQLYRRGIVRNGVFWDDGRNQPLGVGAELHLFVFGLEFEVYPQEWLDAAIGWIGLDSANDDEIRILHQWNERQTIPELKVRNEWKERLREK